VVGWLAAVGIYSVVFVVLINVERVGVGEIIEEEEEEDILICCCWIIGVSSISLGGSPEDYGK